MYIELINIYKIGKAICQVSYFICQLETGGVEF